MRDRAGPSHPEALSIVVPAFNSARTIDACLAAIMAHVPSGSRQVIVVDNGSTDETAAIARRYPVRIESVPVGFVARVRNAGAARATCALVAFVDSDCVIRPGWHDAIVSAFSDNSIGVVGRRHEIPDRPTWVEAAWHSAHQRPVTAALVDVPYVPAGNLAVRRDMFEAVDGFDESLETGEDPDLCARIAARGHRVVECAEMRCVHLGEPKSLREVFRRERWHGRGVRLRYADGRIAPVVLATIAFAMLGLVAFMAPAVAVLRMSSWPLALAAAPLVVPGAYALRYARPRRLPEILRLLLVYVAYFAGRASALPVAIRRMRAAAS